MEIGFLTPPLGVNLYVAGSLAKMERELRTFIGEMIAIRDSWYSKKGEELKAEIRYLDLETENPKDPDGEFYDIEEPVYLRLEQIPIYKMIGK